MNKRGRNTTVRTLMLLAIIAACGAGLAYRQDLRAAYDRYRRGDIPAETSRKELTQTAVTTESISDEPQQIVTPPTEKPIVLPVEFPEPIDSESPKTPVPENPPAVTDPVKPSAEQSLPKEFNLKVPFIPQAPFRVWDDIHEDACEEASALMLQAYYNDEMNLSLDEMERRILAVQAYETETFGYHHDTDAEQTATFMRKTLGLTGAQVMTVDSADDIRRQIATGRPVIIPAYGKRLRNPNFRNGGPDYHMLVIKGYRTDGAFITNDPGTRLGENYVYDEETIMESVRDWNGGDVLNGARVMIVVR